MYIFLNILLLVVCVFSICYFFYSSMGKSSLALYYWPVITIMSFLLSVFYLDVFNVYIIDQSRESAPNLSFLIFSIYFLINIGLVLFFSRNRVLLTIEKSKFDVFWVVICGLSLAVLYFNYFLSVDVIFSPVDRFTYWQDSKLSSLYFIFGNTSLYVSLFGIALLVAGKYRTGLIIVLFHLFYLILIGHKAAVPFVIVLMLFSSVIAFDVIKLKPAYLLFIPLLVVVVMGLVYYKYEFISNPYESLGHLGVGAVMYRVLALQGNLFWGAVQDLDLTSWAPEFISKPMLTSMSKYMELTDRTLVDGVHATNAMPGALIEAQGVLGLLIVILVMPVILYGLYYIYICFNKKSTVFVYAVSTQGFLWVYNSYYMGNWKGVMKGCVVLLVLYLIKIVMSRNIGKSNI